MKIFYRILHLLTKNPKMNNIQVLFLIFDSVVLKFIKKPKRDDTKRILLVFTHALGDLVMFMGSIKYLKEIYDGYEISILCNEQYIELVEDQFDNVLAFNFQKTSLNPLYRIKYLKTLRKQYYDFSIDPIETTTYAPNLFAVHAVVADNKIGIDIDRSDIGKLIAIFRHRMYSKLIPVSSSDHRVKNFADFFSKIENKEYEPAITYIGVIANTELPIEYCIIYPSASIPEKRWSVKRFAEIAGKIYEKYRMPIVCCGTSLDREIVNEFIDLLLPEVPIIDLVGKTNVREFVNVIGNSEIVITNDTSVYHIALATRRKTCIISGEYTYNSFLDYSAIDIHNELKLEIVSSDMKCRNCYGRCLCEFKVAYPCIECVEEDKVWGCIQTLMDGA